MLDSSLARILDLPGDWVVLDIGGWGKPLVRADWVIDLMPYETRGLYGRAGEGPERFTADTWIERDVCDHEPFPFADKTIDFAICSHTLEDIRDPIWVCHELNRVAKAGYVEVPSRLEEQSYGFQGPWTGWGHHHWLVDVDEDGLEFVFKHAPVHGRDEDRFPAGFRATLTEEERVQTLWWEGSFSYRERVMMSAEEVDPYLADFVARHRPPTPERSPARRGLRSLRRLARRH